jgi:dihydrodiol dehydrogenase / D-xylose 1-dehydrogenase (NADP)
MRWGVLGYGEIAPSFIDGLMGVEGQELHGIASRSKHQELAEKNTYPRVRIHREYSDLLSDPDIDTIYVCTINSLHKENVLDALRAGKNVLCEKPLGVCQPDVEEMILEAKNQNKYLMEGMWTRFLPGYKHFKQRLEDGIIGNIGFARIDFGFRSDWGPKRRLKSRAQFGGTILDNADYGIFLSQDVFRQHPARISTIIRSCETGVEDMCGVMLQYPNGSMSQLFSSFQLETRQEALIYGEKGYFHLKPFWNGTVVALRTAAGEQYWEFPFRRNGFEYEIEEAANCIRDRQMESNVVPHHTSIEIAGIMDKIIGQSKVRS